MKPIIEFSTNNGLSRRSYITGILISCVFCGVLFFLSSSRFVNVAIIPKWMGLFLSAGIAGVIFSLWCKKIDLPAKQIFIFLICCFLIVLLRDGTESGLNPALTVYLSALILLFFLLQQVVISFHAKILFGIIIVFALALSMHGFLQYSGLIHSGSSKFAITESFDNPAGFASVLVCVLPLCFIFFEDRNKYFRYLAIASLMIIATAVFLTGSRAGMFAIAVAMVVWLFQKNKYLKIQTSFLVRLLAKFAIIIAIIALSIVLYFFKKDSADGRLLIWRCTLDMIADKPVIGQGHCAFQEKYMLYQAAYLNAHPDSQYAQLADNVLHPFNEYLLILSEHGLIGLGALTLAGFFLVRAYRRNSCNERLAALISILALSVFSFFSYPFKYPFTWLILFLNVTVICKPCREIPRKYPAITTPVRCFAFLLSAGLLASSLMLTHAEITWNRIARKSLAGQTLKVLPEYDQLYLWLGKNGLFLYNHSAELHEAKDYEKSIAVFKRCTQHFNDMDVQMLLADNYKELGKYAEAKQHLKTAAAMCPSRFMPLYELVKLYEAGNCKDEALALAQKILDKDVKIPSSTVTAIKNEMRQLIEAQEMTDVPENDCRTSDEPLNNETRQGGTPNGAALPP